MAKRIFYGFLTFIFATWTISGFTVVAVMIPTDFGGAVFGIVLSLVSGFLTYVCFRKTLGESALKPKTKPKAKSKAKPAASRSTGSTDELAFVDQMDGHAFEHFIADLLQKLGYERVEVTRGSGDQGVDVVARKNGTRFAIQCKRYSKKLGNKPVQEAFAGKSIYGCNVAVVVTNNYFTEGAKEAARSTGVLLWDRDELRQMIRFSNWKNL